MPDPKRLIDMEHGDALTLLRAGCEVSAPPAHALEKALQGLGITAPAKMTAVSSLGIAKCVMFGVVIGAGVPAALLIRDDSLSPRPVASIAARSFTRPAAPPAPLPSGVEEVPSAAASREPPQASARVLRVPAPARSEIALKPSLADENRYLDRVRSLLAIGAAGSALAALDEYETRFRPGQLAPEAALFRVRAYRSAGRIEAARDLAEQLLQGVPPGDYASRVREAAGLPAR